MNIEFKAKKVFVFDWDGTVFDSMAIKAENFARVILESIGDRTGITLMQARNSYRLHSGKPRREIFALIASEFGLDLSDEEMNAISVKLTALNMDRLANAEIFADAHYLLDYLTTMRRRIYISSSVPSVELQTIVEMKLPSRLHEKLAGVYGSDSSFTKGKEHLRKVATDAACDSSACLMFGDDLADLELCHKAAVDCVLVDRDGSHVGQSENTISSLSEVCQWLN